MPDLERALTDLGRRLAVPDEPAPELLAERVRAELAAAPVVTRTQPRRGWLLAVAASALLVLVVGLTPAGRAAAGQLLRIAGLEVTWGQPTAPVAPSAPLPGTTPSDLDEARAAASFPLRTPTGLGDPAAVEVADGGRVVSLLYRTDTGDVRLDQFDGTLDPVFVKTTLAQAQQVRIGDVDGLWFAQPHDLTYVLRDGSTATATARLAGPTLVWESDGVTHRVEGAPSLPAATSIARGLQR